MATMLFAFFFLFIVLCFFFQLHSKKPNNLPRGSFGWPLLGETLEFLRSLRDGTPERFVQERIKRHGNPLVFKTSLFGSRAAVFCGPEGNKFLFGNENKLVRLWQPKALRTLYGKCLFTSHGDEAKWLRKMMMPNLTPSALSNSYFVVIDTVTRLHVQNHWEGRSEVKVFDTARLYFFEVACRLFLSLDDPKHVAELVSLAKTIGKGMRFPIDIPGTRFHRAKRAASAFKNQLITIINQRKHDKQENASSFEDLLSHLLLSSNKNGRLLSEMEIANNIMFLILAGHNSSTASITLLMKCLATQPNVYVNVLEEQLSILDGKAPGEVLNWEDMKKMRYSWNVVCEVLRLNPPAVGNFREALEDFEYMGYTIPKGWKIFWSASMTHREEDNFLNATKFDPSRFEGTGPAPFTFVPFGGGPRMCLGKEIARAQLLVFLHNIVTKFKWELLIPNEKIEYKPLPTPVKGLPIRLHPHQI